jgi:hypothetical protein
MKVTQIGLDNGRFFGYIDAATVGVTRLRSQAGLRANPGT